MWVFEGRTCSVGTRQIAKRLGFSKTTVVESLHHLAEIGAVAISKSGHGKRTLYVLSSPLFGQKQGKETIVASAPNGSKRYVSVRIEEVA